MPLYQREIEQIFPVSLLSSHSISHSGISARLVAYITTRPVFTAVNQLQDRNMDKIPAFHLSHSPSAIIIGAGPSGISLAHTLKYKMGFEDFMVSSDC